MNIKNSLAKCFGVILALLISSAVLHAQGSMSATKADTNTAAAPTGSSAADTNALSTTNAGSQGSVQTDNNRIRIVRVPNGRPWNEPPTVVVLKQVFLPIILVFCLPVAILVAGLYFRHRRTELVHETLRAMVEKGVPMTPELIAGLNPRSRNRYLLPGLILTGTGLALLVTHPHQSVPVGLIVLFMGLAFLIVWRVERKEIGNGDRKHEDRQQPSKI